MKNGFRFCLAATAGAAFLMVAEYVLLCGPDGSFCASTYLLEDDSGENKRSLAIVGDAFYSGAKNTLGLGSQPDSKRTVSRYNGTCIEPSNSSVPDWQKRAPLFAVIGMQKCGTKALHYYLAEHPLRSRKQGPHIETHFFDRVDSKGGNAIAQKFYRSQVNRTEKGIFQATNRRLYSDIFLKHKNEIEKDPRRFAFDDSPRYMLFSDRVPDALFCVAPWIKLIALLRNPVDRVISSYNMLAQKAAYQGLKLDWDEYLGTDLQLLRESGVMQDWDKVDFDNFAGSHEETLAWEEYLDNFMQIQRELPLGRGLYAIMLQHFFTAMDKWGKPRSDMLILQSEEMLGDTQGVYDSVADFLDMPHYTLPQSEVMHPTTPGDPIPEEWRKFLVDFYKPYNRRLYKMLGWSPVWETA